MDKLKALKTPEQVAVYVAEHLVTQNERAWIHNDDYEGCAYRAGGEDGKVLKCAVGCIIADDHYMASIEGVNIGSSRDLEVFRLVEKSIGLRCSEGVKELLGDLQSIHDDTMPWSWTSQLIELFNKLGFKLPAFLAIKVKKPVKKPAKKVSNGRK